MWGLGLETAKCEIVDLSCHLFLCDRNLSISVLPENRDFVTLYLSSYNLSYVDALCYVVSDDTTYPHEKLEEVTEALMKQREEDMKRRLESIKYNIDDESTLRLVSGKERVEIVSEHFINMILFYAELLLTKI